MIVDEREPNTVDEIISLVRRYGHENFKNFEEMTLMEAFVNKHIVEINEVLDFELGIVIPITILCLGEESTVLEGLSNTWNPKGAALEYLRKTGPKLYFDEEEKTYEQSEEPSDDFSEEEYRRLLLDDEEFKEALDSNVRAYELLKNKIESVSDE